MKALTDAEKKSFEKWAKAHMPIYEELKNKIYKAVDDDEVLEIMAYMYFFGAEDWDNLVHEDDLK